MPTHGLTLGKYAPLHRGHQYVIETALAEMDRVSVIIYDAPDTTSIPLSVRTRWIQSIYPQVDVILAWDGPTEVGNTAEIRHMHEDYILNQLKIKDITHFYSSEFYGEHMSRALGAVNRIVDSERSNFSISATEIRQSPSTFKQYIEPVVYRDLITSIVFLGAPSTGKTTIAEELAKIYSTVWMPEYGREYWEKHQIERRLTPQQLVDIAEGHLERESKLLFTADHYLFVDTNALTTYMFAQSYHGSVLPRLSHLALAAASSYDLVFLCSTDIPYDDTWDRSGDVSRHIFQKQIIDDLKVRRIPFFTLRGTPSKRIKYVQEILSIFNKYDSIADLLISQGVQI